VTALAVIALGSNLGDRQATLEHAVAALDALPESSIRAVSSWHGTIALTLDGPDPDKPEYLNGVALLDTRLDPFQLLDGLRAIENLHGRERHERWGDRTLDLDLIAFGPLGEPEPRVEPEPLGRDACRERGVGARSQLVAHVGDDVGVVAHGIPPIAAAAPVHRDVIDLELSDRRQHRGVLEPAAHVVDDDGAGLDGGPRGRRVEGVDRDADALRGERAHDRHHARRLLDRGHGLGAGPGRLAPDVDDVGTVVDEPAGLRDRGLGLEPAPAVAERVGRDVEHAPHLGPLEPGRGGHAAPRPIIAMTSARCTGSARAPREATVTVVDSA